MLKELVTRFGFEIDDKALKELQDGIDAVKEGVLHLGEALVGEAVGLYELVNHSSEAAVQLRIMSQQTGVAADRLQELQFRAKLTNVSAEDLSQSMFYLNRNMTEAANGSTMAQKNFRRLGISSAELRSGTLTTDQALKRIAATFEKLPDGPRKAGLAADIFGRSGKRMIPFLNELSQHLDPVNQKIFEMSKITEEQIEQGEAFHVNLETLKAGIGGIIRVVGFGLMPVATEIIEQMKKWITQNRQLIVQNLTDFIKGMTAALKITVKIVDALIQSFSGLAHSIGGVEFATKLLLGTFAIISGVSVLFGIGKVITAVYELAGAFEIADLAAAAIPIAIGAAMVALLLIMEDIYSFFSGKKSFTGDLLEKLPELGKLFKAVFEPIFGPFVNIVTMLTEGFGSWKDIFKELGVLIVNTILLPIRAVLSAVGGIGSIIGRLTGSSGIQKFANDVNQGADFFKLNGLTGADAVTPETAVGSGVSTSKQTNNNLQVSQQFNFPPGTDPAVVGDKISSSVSSGLDDVLRQTNRSTSNGGAY